MLRAINAAWVLIAAAVIGTGLVAWRAAASDAGVAGPANRCKGGSVWFKSRCVQKNECCDPALCPAGTVLEYDEQPECVPCAQAEAQQPMNFCADHASADADKTLNVLYRQLSDRYPSERARLKAAEHAWIQFRDKLCEAFAGTYEGGSMQPQVRAQCLEKETRRQIDRLKELQQDWAGLAP